MKILSREELGILVGSNEKLAVSIYMPAHRTGDIKQDPIRLNNLIKEAENQLADYGVGTSNARKLLEPARRMLSDSLFWQHQGDGLAIFSSDEIFRHYRLPYSFQEQVTVAERFHITPLLPIFTEDGVFYVLAISQNRVKLLQCTRYYVLEVTPEAVPESLAETLKDDLQQHLQFRTIGRAAGGDAAMFHGQGGGKDDSKAEILRYFRQIDRGIYELLREEHAPLVIAAVDYLHPIYREASTYNHLTDEAIEGNPDDLSAEELQERAWEIVQPHFKLGRTEALENYNEAITKGLATNDVKEVVLSAYAGRVSVLFVTPGARQWGAFDPESHDVRLYKERQHGAKDLFDLAVASTLIKGGTVYAVQPEQLSGETPVAALFRY